jgi:hypothetical protein
MAQAASRRSLTTGARVVSLFSPCLICSGQSGTVTGFSSSFSVFSCQYHSTVAPYLCIIWKMNIRPVGGRSSEAVSVYRHEQHEARYIAVAWISYLNAQMTLQ